MSSEPHFPLAPWFPSLQRTVLWTEMEVLQCGVASSWGPHEPQLSAEQRLPQSSCAPAKPRALSSAAGLHRLGDRPDRQHWPQ